MCAALIDDLTTIATRAAGIILDLAPSVRFRTKSDGSPVTAADEAAEAAIIEGVRRIAPELPIVSEECAEREKPPIIEAGSYFLVDPLDGTREFIAGRNEYTLNIAIVTDGAPMLGIICAPALGSLWRGIVGRTADRLHFTGVSKPEAIHVRRQPQQETIVMVSRSHLDPQTQAYAAKLPNAKLVRSGSAVKFCRVAEGSADQYPRLGPTRDWDVAAGHAIVAAAGGGVTAPGGGSIIYGTETLTIPAFVAAAAFTD